MIKYGINPRDLEEHYKEFGIKAAELKQRDIAAARKTSFMGFGSYFATLAALIIPFGKEKRSLSNRFSSGNKLIGGFLIGIAPLFIGLFSGGWLGSRLFGQSIRKESGELAHAVRSVLERELAVAIENKEIETTAQKPMTAQQNVAVTESRKTTLQPRESFGAEVAKEKAASQAAGAGQAI